MDEIMEVYMPLCGLKDRASWPNSCTLCLYEDGSQCAAWRSYDEELFQGASQDTRTISLTLGSLRRFQLRLKQQSDTMFTDMPYHGPMFTIALRDGDLCTMEGETQKHYEHCIPEITGDIGPSFLLTWRWVVKHQEECLKQLYDHRIPVPFDSFAGASDQEKQRAAYLAMLGEGAKNMRHMREKSGCRLQLRGEGDREVRLREGDAQREPLHIMVKTRVQGDSRAKLFRGEYSAEQLETINQIVREIIEHGTPLELKKQEAETRERDEGLASALRDAKGPRQGNGKDKDLGEKGKGTDIVKKEPEAELPEKTLEIKENGEKPTDEAAVGPPGAKEEVTDRPEAKAKAKAKAEGKPKGKGKGKNRTRGGRERRQKRSPSPKRPDPEPADPNAPAWTKKPTGWTLPKDATAASQSVEAPPPGNFGGPPLPSGTPPPPPPGSYAPAYMPMIGYGAPPPPPPGHHLPPPGAHFGHHR
jgi:hypothetical protein